MRNRINAGLIIFDLDGTLIDSKKDISDALNETLKAMNLPPLPEALVYSYVGNGVRPLLEKVMAESGKADGIGEAIEHFRRIYPLRLLDTTVMFEGVPELLDRLQSSGRKMGVASNKPYKYVADIIDGLKMSDYFLSVLGGDSLDTKKPAPEMIDSIIADAGTEKEDTVFIGDSAVDIEAGKNAGVKTVGVTYGFRPREEVIMAKPDEIAENLDELKEILV